MTPPSNPSLASIPLVSLERIDELCSSFEAELNSNRSPKIEDFLKSDDADERQLLLRELLHLELTKKMGLGLSATQADYETRFSEYPDIVRDAFEPPHTAVTSSEAVQDDRVDDELLVGQKIAERYLVTSLLGSGGFSDVYLAEDTESQRQVALKVLKPSRDGDADSLLAEARILSDLEHPNIAHAFDSGRANGVTYIALRYVDGKTLAATIQEFQQDASTQPDVDQIVRWTTQICDALQFAHQKGLTHRDIKPHNVLIDSDRNAVVADFGFALHEANQEQHYGDRSGTPFYRSPEQVRGEADWLDGRSDVWAVGIVLYEMLAGQRPFRGSTLDEIDRQILQRPAKPLRQINPSIPGWLEAICLKCLSKSPTERYSTAVELAQALRAKRHPSALRINRILAGVACLLVAVAVAFGLRANRESIQADENSKQTAHVTKTSLQFMEDFVRNTHDTLDDLEDDKSISRRVTTLENAISTLEDFNDNGRRAKLLKVSLRIRLADEFTHQKDQAAAKTQLQQCVEILRETLRNSAPHQRPPTLRLLGLTNDRLGNIEKNTDALAAIEYYEAARRHRVEWLRIVRTERNAISSSPYVKTAKDAPAGIENITELERAQQGLGTSYLTLGGMYRRDPSKYHQARTSFQALVDVRKSLLDAHPDLMHSKQVYAGALRDLGTAEEASGAYDLAIDNYEKSIDMLRDIIATQTHSPPRNLIVPKQNIAIHLRNLGSGYFRTGQHEKSIDAFEEAIEHLEYLQHNHSLSKQTKQRVELKLAQCNYSLGLHQMFRGRTEETFFENSLSLFSKHDSFERAFPLARLHRRDEAVQLAEEYVLNDPSVASVFWRGRLYAACAWSAKTQNQTYDFMRFRNLAIGDIEKSLVAGVSPFVVRDDPELQFLESDPLYQARISTRCVANKAATN